MLFRSENSAGAHIHLWQNAIELISENPVFGTGIGDVKDQLMGMYRKNNYINGLENQLNPHNQYLQTGVALGLVGIILLVIIFLNGLVISFKNNDWIAFLFIAIVSLNCLTESMLERRAGILFFALFYSLFFTPGNIMKTSFENHTGN